MNRVKLCAGKYGKLPELIVSVRYRSLRYS